MDQVKREKLLDKVRKCLALSNCQNATPAERERALAQAEKLLASANLSMADATVETLDRERQGHDLAPELREWVRPACNGIARLFFCNAYKEVSTGRQYYVGQPVNVAATVMMVEYVLASIAKEAKIQMSVEQGRAVIAGVSYPRSYWKEWTYSFSLGAAQEVKKRCEAMILERETKDDLERGTGTAIILYDLAKAEAQRNIDFLKALGVTLSKSGGANPKLGGAYNAGAEHGKSISLNRQIARNDGPKLLGR